MIGLFRLWWIPAGAGATEGTYVRYDHDASIGILALEAARAGAVLVGEDLGTVEPWVRDYLRERGILGTSVLWFEFDYDGGGGPLAPERWREYCLASVTTHDLPPTAGYLAGDHIELRNDLGLLVRTVEEELDADRAEQGAWLDAMRERGLLAPDADRDETVLALHRALTFSPARLRCLALTDAVGDRRIQNQPGATDGPPELADAAVRSGRPPAAARGRVHQRACRPPGRGAARTTVIRACGSCCRRRGRSGAARPARVAEVRAAGRCPRARPAASSGCTASCSRCPA